MIIALISSMKFKEQITEQTRLLSLQGHIVLAPVFCSDEEGQEKHDLLVALHKGKLNMCDKALVLNIGGYIGEDGQQEILYCRTHGIPIDYISAFKSEKNNYNDLYLSDVMCTGEPITTMIYKGPNPIEAKGCFEYLTHKKETSEPMPLMGTNYKVRVIDVMTKQEEIIFDKTMAFEISFKAIVL